jgi:hypothetical protein
MFWSFIAAIFITDVVKDARGPHTEKQREINRDFARFLWKWIFVPFALLTIVYWMVDQVHGQTINRTFQDSMGRNVGRSSTDTRGNTTFYDASGRNTGRSSTSGNTTTFYDNMGRQTGRSSK